ncbi:MAG: hypothetical protein CVU44_05210 [Chloroflexi bacterium HGW-Chloroflexi-6]|nr:MAG: hypothetical protein CVU44_05210 [Chloroflexi bacterium HGW-Chloroflexi-6]
MFISLSTLALTKMLAYLDPGSGSMLMQLLLAALLGMGVLVRSQWKRIKNLFGRKDDEDQDDEPKE